jgi:WD40 repeat protein
VARFLISKIMPNSAQKRSKYFSSENAGNHTPDGSSNELAAPSSSEVSPAQKSSDKPSDQPRFITEVLPPFPSAGHGASNLGLNPLQRSLLKGKTPVDPSRLYIAKLPDFNVKKSIAYFDRRVTQLEWHTHPSHPTVLAIASKGGDLIWYDYLKNQHHAGYTGELVKENGFTMDSGEPLPYIYGQGPGGSITACKFHPSEPQMIFTASIDGTVKKQDFEGKATQTYLDTMNKEKWYTALDVSAEQKVFAIGSTSGEVLVKDLDGKSIWSGRVHKSKVHDVEFHPFETHYFVSAGHDKVLLFIHITQTPN